MDKLNIAFVSGNPNFLGGFSLYQNNLTEYLKKSKDNFQITWIYFGRKLEKYKKRGITFISLKTPNIPFLDILFSNFKLLKFFKKNNYDLINVHAGPMTIPWLNFYRKKENQKIFSTHHGITYSFNMNHLNRIHKIFKIFLIPLIFLGGLVELPYRKKLNGIICVSEKVKEGLIKLYGRRNNMKAIRTGVNLKKFKLRNKIKCRKKLKLNKDGLYGLYIGRGGYWTKGLDLTVKLSEELYKLNKKYRLIVAGPDYQKVKDYINKEFIKYIPLIKRNIISYYYNSADIFFCLSRYEGGAPTLVVSEAMASGCFVVSSKSAEQEIIENKKNGIIIGEFGKKDAEKILNILKNKPLKERIIKNSMKTIKELSLEKWGKEYIKVLKE